MLEDMGVKGAFPIKVDKNLHSVGIVLKSAACEWLLLFFLLLDAAFSYFLTKFAQYCDLQVPCILCSRLDNVFDKENPNFYGNILCNVHKSELSSSILCQNHGKLADVHDMCEECLLSFAKKDLNEEMHKILVGKLGLDCLEKPFLSMDSHIRSCSCCGKPWRSRPNVQKTVQSKLYNSHASKPDIPLPKSPAAHRSLNRQEGLKKRKDQLSSSPLIDEHTNNDCRSHYDSEFDFQYSDGDFLPIHRIHPDDGSEKGETTTPTCLRSYGDGKHIFAETPPPNALEIAPISSEKLNFSRLSKGKSNNWESIDLNNSSTTMMSNGTRNEVTSTMSDKCSSCPLKSLQESVSEIEFNNLVQKLEHSTNCIADLRKELEEERNASSVAANQAMAMITKLQEEKAALNMESLQYLRMMEEQSEYDMEALEKATDLLTEKENEVQDLEAELDYFRLKYPEDFPDYLNMHDQETTDIIS